MGKNNKENPFHITIYLLLCYNLVLAKNQYPSFEFFPPIIYPKEQSN